MLVTGNSEYLYQYEYPVEVVVDVFVPDKYVWVTAPMYRQSANGQYEEVVSILSSPKNYKASLELLQKHTEIYNSSLMKALREDCPK